MCQVNSCRLPVYRDHFCCVHYARNKMFGSTIAPRKRDSGTLEERFHKKYFVDAETGCWLWFASCQGDGYATIQDGRKNLLATRYSYELAYDKILLLTDKLCHTCDTPNCVNPTHFFVGTDQDNATDKRLKRRNCHVGRKNELSVKDVLTIRQSSKGRKELALEYCVTPKTISNIQLGKTFQLILSNGAELPLPSRNYIINKVSACVIYHSSLPNVELAKHFNVNPGVISGIKLGVSWYSTKMTAKQFQSLKSSVRDSFLTGVSNLDEILKSCNFDVDPLVL